MVVYPISTLPLSGFVETPKDYGQNRSDFFIPYSQSFPLTTGGNRKFSITHSTLTATEKAIFDAFWSAYAAAGTFQLVHPRTGSTLTCVIPEGSLPQIKRDGPVTWDVTCEMEEQL